MSPTTKTTAPTKARTKARKHVLPVYREIDVFLAKELPKVGAVSCKRGCSSCCELLVVLTSGEAEVLADAIMGDPVLRESVHVLLGKLDVQTARLEAWGAEFGGDNLEAIRYAWWQSRQNCAMLDGETKACRAYADRPSPCRTYHVVSESLLCGERGKSGESVLTAQVRIPDEAQARILWRLARAASASGLDVLVGSLPQLLGIALRRKLDLPPRESLGGASVLG